MARIKSAPPKATAKGKATPEQAKPAPTYFAPEDAGLQQRIITYQGGEPAFYLYHRPGCYYLKAGKVLPRLEKLHRVGGIANVGQTRVRTASGGYAWEPDMSLAFADLHRDNCAIIPHNVDADTGFPSYLMEIPGRPGRYCHRLQELVPGMAPQPVPSDQWCAWLESLMERGHIQRPHAAEVEKVAAQANRLAEQHTRAGEARHAAGLLAQLEQLSAAQGAA